MKSLQLSLALGIGLASALIAQESSPVSFNIGAGFTKPTGGTGDRLNTGWNMQGGVGYNFIPNLGAMVQFNYNSFGINDATLNNFGVPDGNVRLWSLTLNPIVHLNPKGKVDAYVIGGGGLYHRTQEFTRPSVAFATAFDPFFGFFYDVAVPVDEVIASRSVMKPGWNIGGGVAFGSKWKGKFYAEARYHRMMFRNTNTDFIPVNFGYRW